MRRPTKLRLRPRTSDLREWMERMGYNGHQVSMAGDLIGLKATTLSQTRNGQRDLSLAERLAMTAVRAGLQPWSPEYDDELMAELKGLHRANDS